MKMTNKTSVNIRVVIAREHGEPWFREDTFTLVPTMSKQIVFQHSKSRISVNLRCTPPGRLEQHRTETVYAGLFKEWTIYSDDLSPVEIEFS